MNTQRMQINFISKHKDNKPAEQNMITLPTQI